jgi:peptide/nickel transport system substrate-binding protein
MARDQTPYCSAVPNPFKNKLARQAIHIGVNRAELVEDLPTFGVPATQPLPPFVFGYNPHLPHPAPDLQKAKALLAQAGYPNGFDVTLHYRNNTAEAAKIIQRQLAKLNIRIKLETGPSMEFLTNIRQHKYSFMLGSMGCPTGDASDVLDNALHSVENGKRFGTLNYGSYANPEVDRAIEQSAEIQDMDLRRDAIQNVMKLVMDDLPWIPVYIDQDVYALHKDLRWKPRNDSFIFAWEMN